ncbi:VOC family protein [Conexibacter sp. S30A1]|uniref:VOC family protein n=1 Tax=Conexibacter sp. S30A1 TaxID=2937800 RepID=UPI00200DDE56|nr:VOC family protein [Conexibacter sp. S30A1]
MFDHVGVAVSDLDASTDFYRTVLSVLGREPSHADELMVGWEDWWIGTADAQHPLTSALHVGLRASSRAMVDAFWRAGIEAGFPDAGSPGPRAAYAEDDHGAFLLDDHGAFLLDHHGAFLLDPDGHNVELLNHNR